MFHKSVKRKMLGGEESPEMIIIHNTVHMTQNAAGYKKYKPDCEIRFYIGGRPIVIHNDTSIDIEKSISDYRVKLDLIKDMVLDIRRTISHKDDSTYLVRNFLNQYSLEGSLFGGSLQIHYSCKTRQITFDISDCTNKTRRVFNKEDFFIFSDILTKMIDASLEDLIELEISLIEYYTNSKQV